MLVIYTWLQCASFMTSRIKPIVQIKYKDGKKGCVTRTFFYRLMSCVSGTSTMINRNVFNKVEG